MRGPGVLPRRPGTRGRRPTDRERFDDLVLAVVTDLEERWQEHLGLLEYAVEDVPHVTADAAWDVDDPDVVPLASLVRGSGTTPSRVVVFRRPLEHRSTGREDLAHLVLTVVVEQVAELLGLDPATVDPRVAEDGDADG